ncbi:MAG: hypothetical protein CVV64_15835 [Candidatus Wallbacteria bacterium HGW-Wallbacteria-1]|jgi:hypothetical protein|uniref:Putative heavy-metal chelation domain-containing protein n=1 Tax=Candidatus Wallbacteria bacterium HGW-Wallbacteria-1 TaxID=2013854 RepID=A0A2N1PL74_9BACT|nr:MAG: hypothetical protein CVV64_15835 [Candidatus Wallbacteria bacterium HGW-Wallbacteria-1]
MINLALENLREKFIETISTMNLPDFQVTVRARPLTSQEAIGNPEHHDYPIQKGKERLMEAIYGNGKGVAFTDMFGDFDGTLSEILSMDLSNNFRRAILTSTMNAVLNHQGLIDKTSHCKDTGPGKCGLQVAEWVKTFILNSSNEKLKASLETGGLKILLVGMQPRLLEGLSSEFDVRITDMDRENIGKVINGVEVMDAGRTDECLQWCDMIMATGTTLVNDSADQFIRSGKPLVLYGVTCAAAAWMHDLPRYCPEGF